MNQVIDTTWSTRLDHSPVLNFLIVGDQLMAVAQSLARDASAYLMALDRLSGESQWSYNLKDSTIGGLATWMNPASEPRLLLTVANRDFFLNEVSAQCYDLQGIEQWSWRSEGQTISAPACFDDFLSFTVDSERYIQLDVATGREQLRVKLELPASFSAPYWHDNTVFIPGNGLHLQAINREGKHLWQYQVEGSAWLDKTPIIAGKLILSVSSKGVLLALDIATGVPIWQASVGSAERPLSPPTVYGQNVYVGARDGMYALDLRRGQEVWSFLSKRSFTAQPLIYNQTVYAASRDHHLYGLAADKGEELWRYQMERYIELPPSIVEAKNGTQPTIYVIDRGGNVVALQQRSRLKTARTTPQSPSEQQNNQKFEEKIEILEAESDITAEAETQYQAGNLEKAAEYFELGGKWQRAADLWKEVGSFLKYAQALEGYAHHIDDEEEKSEEERIAAWSKAAKAYETEGEKAKADYCKDQIAKHEKLPILDLNIKHNGLKVKEWSKLELTVMNQGYGPARRIEINIGGDQFDAHIATSNIYFGLLPHKTLVLTLSVQPLQYGDGVPMKLTLDYQDIKAQMHNKVKTIFVQVARERSEQIQGQIQNVFAAKPSQTEGLKTLFNISEVDLVELRQKLHRYFNAGELRDLCFELKVDYEDLITERKSDFAREVVLYLHRRKRLQDLISICERKRPHINW